MNTGEWGGVDVLVMRLAHFLREQRREFVILDKEGSRLRHDLPWASFMAPERGGELAGRVTHVFLPSVAKLRESEIPWGAVPTAKVFAWIVQHNDVLYQFFPHASFLVRRFGFRVIPIVFNVLRARQHRIASMLQLMASRDALAAMDHSTERSLRFFYPQVLAEIPTLQLPVPLGNYAYRPAARSKSLTIGYLGRMDSFKFSALEPFLRHDLADVVRDQSVRLVAVTAGTHVERLVEVCREVGVDLQLKGFMPNEAAREFIVAESDFAVAMGTAALDLAAMGHPCLYIDPSEKTVWAPQRLYRFVHETDRHMVGEFRDFPGYVGGLRTLRESIDLLADDTLGKRGREYVKEQHDPERIFARFVSHIDRSKLTMSELEPYVTAIRRSNARDLALVKRARRLLHPFRRRRERAQ